MQKSTTDLEYKQYKKIKKIPTHRESKALKYDPFQSKEDKLIVLQGTKFTSETPIDVIRRALVRDRCKNGLPEHLVENLVDK